MKSCFSVAIVGRQVLGERPTDGSDEGRFQTANLASNDCFCFLFSALMSPSGVQFQVALTMNFGVVSDHAIVRRHVANS